MFSSQNLSDQPQTQPLRQMLLLDLDHNLLLVDFGFVSQRNLSKSAEGFLDESYLENVNMEARANWIASRVHVICKEKWLSVFQKINTVNARYRELNPQDSVPLITVGVLTNATYSKKEIHSVLSRFFGGEVIDALIGKLDDNIFYYNRHSQFMTHKPGDGKGALMGHFFELPEPGVSWLKRIPGLKKEDIYLIDDDEENGKSVMTRQFSFIHHPTSVEGRDKGISYQNEHEGVFNKLHEIVAKAEKCCNELQQKARIEAGNKQGPGI